MVGVILRALVEVVGMMSSIWFLFRIEVNSRRPFLVASPNYRIGAVSFGGLLNRVEISETA